MTNQVGSWSSFLEDMGQGWYKAVWGQKKDTCVVSKDKVLRSKSIWQFIKEKIGSERSQPDYILCDSIYMKCLD